MMNVRQDHLVNTMLTTFSVQGYDMRRINVRHVLELYVTAFAF